MPCVKISFDPGPRNWGVVILVKKKLVYFSTWDLLEKEKDTSKTTLNRLIFICLPRFLSKLKTAGKYVLEQICASSTLSVDQLKLKIFCEKQPKEKYDALSKFLCGVTFSSSFLPIKKRLILFIDKRGYSRKIKRRNKDQNFDIKKEAIKICNEKGYFLTDQHQYDALFLLFI